MFYILLIKENLFSFLVLFNDFVQVCAVEFKQYR